MTKNFSAQYVKFSSECSQYRCGRASSNPVTLTMASYTGPRASNRRRNRTSDARRPHGRPRGDGRVPAAGLALILVPDMDAIATTKHTEDCSGDADRPYIRLSLFTPSS